MSYDPDSPGEVLLREAAATAIVRLLRAADVLAAIDALRGQVAT